MIAIGSARQFYIGVTILAALLILGYNGFALMSLFQPRILGRSMEIKLASLKWLQLENSELSKPQITLADIELNAVAMSFTQSYYQQIQQMMESMVKHQLKAEHIHKGNQKVENQQPTIEETVERQLPVLDGILQVSDVSGRVYSVAIINGKRFYEAETVQDFTVQKITDKGIFLTTAGKSWFIPAPQVRYSVGQGG